MGVGWLRLSEIEAMERMRAKIITAKPFKLLPIVEIDSHIRFSDKCSHLIQTVENKKPVSERKVAAAQRKIPRAMTWARLLRIARFTNNVTTSAFIFQSLFGLKTEHSARSQTKGRKTNQRCRVGIGVIRGGVNGWRFGDKRFGLVGKGEYSNAVTGEDSSPMFMPVEL
ncbi:Hypothetical predicted protein [Prunus dulcis]|uniref:Uncharacterized protein n=1 Tax=Prunus dulcis TaxID=3755 RepID=A0A5E4GBS9_PRUDU|nr:hypothetical protein L3X38_033629 [Prunus dulcis]VVA37060.1 Hypothetical predicted protein [Prunus dulcis]